MTRSNNSEVDDSKISNSKFDDDETSDSQCNDSKSSSDKNNENLVANYYKAGEEADKEISFKVDEAE